MTITLKNFKMRGRERGGGPRQCLRQSHRSVSLEMGNIRVRRGPSRVPQIRGDMGDWVDVRPRRRKAPRQDD